MDTNVFIMPMLDPTLAVEYTDSHPILNTLDTENPAQYWKIKNGFVESVYKPGKVFDAENGGPGVIIWDMKETNNQNQKFDISGMLNDEHNTKVGQMALASNKHKVLLLVSNNEGSLLNVSDIHAGAVQGYPQLVLVPVDEIKKVITNSAEIIVSDNTTKRLREKDVFFNIGKGNSSKK